MNKRIQDIQIFLKSILSSFISEGDVALDLTAGRGRDTLFLAEKVGEKGVVHAFDIQKEALEETKLLLKNHNLDNRVQLYLHDHAQVLDKVNEPIQVATFNLGYLPGSDKEITTNANSTIKAIDAVLSILRPGGIIALTLYRGHLGGKEEAQAVDAYLQTLPRKRFSVLRGEYTNQSPNAPYWILVQKNKGDGR